MKLTNLITFIVAFECSMSAFAIDEGEYYIYNDFYGKALTSNDSGGPVLGDVTTDDASCIFEAVNKSGDYVMLRQKSTGKYLTASTSDTWSLTLSDEGSGDQYYWKLDQLFSTTIISKKNTSKRLGCDFKNGSTYYINETYVPIYYDKSASAMNWFSIIPANGNGFESSRNAAKTAQFTNEYGVTEQDDYQVDEPIQVEGIDYHIISSTPFEGGKVNLADENSWLVFENVRPSEVKSTYLKYVTINGANATTANCRVEMYLRGAVVIPKPSEDPFVATTDEGTFSVKLGNTKDLGENSNKARSFVLKRGYMATVATGVGGEDYSRVYVADHKDITVTLPTALDQRISSVYVRYWHYAAKSGYCSTKSDVMSATAAAGGSWCWNWDASMTSSADVEYVPIKQHLYWPSDGNFDKAGSTAMMLFNEPEHSEQHDDCACGGTISSWKAYQNTPKFNSTGLRIGSPSATDLSYIKEYDNYCYNMKQRCDFNCTHGYWSSEWSSSLSTLKGYGKPIVISEWEYGASWTSGTNPSSGEDAQAKVLNILDMLEYNDYVERYSYYEFDTGGTNGWMREIFYDNTYSHGLSYVGKIYSKVKPHLGYKSSIQPVPNWWAPTFTSPEIKNVTLKNGKYTLTIMNTYADATKGLTVLKQNGTEWETLTTMTDRSMFDSDSLTLTLDRAELTDTFALKAVITSIYTDGTKESDVFSREYCTLDSLNNLLFDAGAFTEKDVLTYAKDVTDNTRQVSGMQPVLDWTLLYEGDAHASAQYAYGSSHELGGTAAPAENSEGTAEGGCLGLLACWGSTTQYVHDIILPIGTYTINIPVYNAGGEEAMETNLIGFMSEEGKNRLATTTKYPVGEWTNEKIVVALTKQTLGRLTLGYTATNVGSGKMPHLFIDHVKITKGSTTWPVPVSVSAPECSASTAIPVYYTPSGISSTQPHKGINIVKMGDGEVKKILVK